VESCSDATRGVVSSAAWLEGVVVGRGREEGARGQAEMSPARVTRAHSNSKSGFGELFGEWKGPLPRRRGTGLTLNYPLSPIHCFMLSTRAGRGSTNLRAQLSDDSVPTPRREQTIPRRARPANRRVKCHVHFPVHCRVRVVGSCQPAPLPPSISLGSWNSLAQHSTPIHPPPHPIITPPTRNKRL
jgi:hypothetical protein